MLNVKKLGFKPKAKGVLARRSVPTPSSKTGDAASSTPTPAPGQESQTPAPESQSAPEPTPPQLLSLPSGPDTSSTDVPSQGHAAPSLLDSAQTTSPTEAPSASSKRAEESHVAAPPSPPPTATPAPPIISKSSAGGSSVAVHETNKDTPSEDTPTAESAVETHPAPVQGSIPSPRAATQRVTRRSLPEAQKSIPTPATAPAASSSVSTESVSSASPQTASPEEPATAGSEPAQAVTPPTDDATTSPPQPSIEASAEPSTPVASAAAPKASRTRKRNADGRETGDAPAPADGAVEPPKKRTRVRKVAPLPSEEGYQPKTTARAKRTRKSRASEDNEGAAAEEGGEGTPRPAKRSGRQREATPEDAETVQLDASQVKMAELAKDMHIGKKFSLHDELMERERMKRQKAYDKRRQKNFGEPTEDGEADQATPGAAAKSESNTPSGGAAATTTADADSPGSGRPGFLAPAGETYQIVDGEIVLDSRSLQVDRHARAAAEAGELEEQEENDFTNHTTSATYLRRNLKPQQWADDETEKFFHALSMFGTDFDTISRMFKTKTRKHVKLKFNREERANPDRIQAALVGEKTVNMSLDEYKRHTGKEYETTEAIDAELKKAETEFEARQKAIEDEKVEEQRRKREALFSGGNKNDGDGEGEGGGGGKKRKRGRGRKAKMGGACL